MYCSLGLGFSSLIAGGIRCNQFLILMVTGGGILTSKLTSVAISYMYYVWVYSVISS